MASAIVSALSVADHESMCHGYEVTQRILRVIKAVYPHLWSEDYTELGR